MSKFRRFFRPLASRRFYFSVARVYLLVLILLVGGQRHFLYQPDRQTAAQFLRKATPLLSTGAELLEGSHALVLTPPGGATAGTALLFHGNAGLGLDRAWMAEPFLSRGYRLVLAEYPGYGARKGWPTEGALVSDADTLLQSLQRQFPGEPVTLVGESLGSGVAVQVAARAKTPPVALVLLTPFRSLAETASHIVKVFPVQAFMSDTFDSAAQLQLYRGPIRVLVADNDELVTPEAGLAMYDLAKARGPAALVRVPGAGHNTWGGKVSASDWDTLLPGAPR